MTTFRVFGTFRASRASRTAPRTTSSRPPSWLPLLLATVHCLTLALGAVGVWLLWPGTSRVLKGDGVLALALDWVVLPRRRGPEGPGATGVRGGYVDRAVLSLRRWEELLSPYRPDATIASEQPGAAPRQRR